VTQRPFCCAAGCGGPGGCAACACCGAPARYQDKSADSQ
jgi:hypothetical protein